jgi:hypothetical protein
MSEIRDFWDDAADIAEAQKRGKVFVLGYTMDHTDAILRRRFSITKTEYNPVFLVFVRLFHDVVIAELRNTPQNKLDFKHLEEVEIPYLLDEYQDQIKTFFKEPEDEDE